MDDTSTNLKIVAYNKPEGNQRNNETQTFTVDFNPNTFVISNKIEYKKEGAKGKTGGDPTFNNVPPIEFSIEFTIDGTGVAAAKLPKAQNTKYSSIRSNKS